MARNGEFDPGKELTFSWFCAVASALFSACVSEITAPCSSSLSRTTPCSSSRKPSPSPFLSGAGLPVIVVNSPIGRGIDEEPPCGLPYEVPLLAPYPPGMTPRKIGE